MPLVPGHHGVSRWVLKLSRQTAMVDLAAMVAQGCFRF